MKLCVKQYLLLDTDGGHYASFERRKPNDTRICLRRSKYGSWCAVYKGSTVGSVDDNGNGAVVCLAEGDIELTLNYGQLADLCLLLERYELNGNLRSKTKPVRVK